MRHLIDDGVADYRQYHLLNVDLKMDALALAMERCDSELERLFLVTYMNYCQPELVVWNEPKPDPRQVGRFFIIDRLNADRHFCRVEAQREIDVEGKTYRVDFLLVLSIRPTSAEDDTSPIAQVAVELDGHDFHERTKQQAAKDRSRDRAFARAGIQVLRFTGSEVYRDPQKAVEESRNFIKSFIPSRETQNV